MKAFIYLLLFPIVTSAQTLIAEYSIVQNSNITLGGKERNVSLDLIGHLYKKGQKYIYWETPSYLKKYPMGEISVNTINGIESFDLHKDTTQWLYYCDFDKMIIRAKVSSEATPIYENSFELGYGQEWIYKPETKTINSLKCQLAEDTANQWKIWFCPDIQNSINLSGIFNLPGLVVQADFLPFNEHYQLISYDTQSAICDAVFEPKEFKQVKKDTRVLKSYHGKPGKKTKLEKQQEILKQ